MHDSAPCLYFAPLLFGLGAMTGCDRDAATSRPAPVAASQTVAPPTPDAARALSPDELASLRDEARRSLKAELHDEVVAELKRELAPQVKAELVAEMHGADAADAKATDATTVAAAVPEIAPVGDTTPTADAAAPLAPDAEAAVMKPGDIWSQPGTKIWPSSGGLRLVELAVGTALEDKLPTDVRTHYPNTPEILYCYTVFENPLPDATVTHVWRRGSRLVSRVELEVGKSPKWRTWSKQRTQPHWTGLWSCEVLGEDGQQLGLTVFQIGG